MIYQPIPTHPAVRRDLAFLVPHGTGAGTVIRAIQAAGESLLESVDVFDVYEGLGVPMGFRSIGFRLVFQASRTLVDADVAPVVQHIIEALTRDLGVKLRTGDAP